MTIYLDYNASAPLKPEVKTAIAVALESVGNPASVHGFGRQTRARLETAREQVAGMVSCLPAQVIFTSGGTEANNLALHNWPGTLLISAIEHDSVLNTPGAQQIPVTVDGLIDLDRLSDILSQATPPILLSVMLVNNETGVIQPWTDIAPLAKRHKALLHCDAVQAAGKLPLNFAALGADMLTLSAHKLGGPQGVGALIIADKIPLRPLLHGGGQEKRRRPGTENLLGVIGFGAAAATAADDLSHQPRLAEWRDAMEQRIIQAVPAAMVVGQGAPRVANTSCVIMPGAKNSTQLMAFDLAGIAVSSGAACSSGKVGPSHVLQAMGYDRQAAEAAIRISSGWDTPPEALEEMAKTWLAVHEKVCTEAAKLR